MRPTSFSFRPYLGSLLFWRVIYKVYITLVKILARMKSLWRCHDAASGSCHQNCGPLVTLRPFASVIVWRNRGVSTSPFCHQDQSLGKIKTFVDVWRSVIILYLELVMTWWSERHGVTLLWQRPQTFCEKLPLNVMTGCIRLPLGFMTGTNCNSHDVIYLKRRTFFRNSPQYCTGTKKTNIRSALSLLAQPVVA